MTVRTTFVRAVSRTVAPEWAARALARMLDCGIRGVGPRKAVGLINLARAYPEKDEAQRREILRGVYRHIALTTAEYLCLVNHPRSVFDWVTEVDGEEELRDLRARGKGAVILSGHFGNWEMLGAWLSHNGYQTEVVARNPDAPDLSELIDSFRTSVGVKTFDKTVSLKMILAHVKRGGFVGIMPDQAWSPVHGIPSVFFGRPCFTAPGPAAVAVLAGVPIVPVAAVRTAPFRHRVIIGPSFEAEPGDDRDDRIRKTILRVDRTLEGIVRRYPEQWLWLHRRWPRAPGDIA